MAFNGRLVVLLLGLILSMAALESRCEQAGEPEDMMRTLKRQVDDTLRLFSLDSPVNKSEAERLHPLDELLLDVVPTFFNQRPNNENGTESQFRDYIMGDDSNDDAWRLSGIEIIKRSGFKYETYDAIADDGYITIMTRIVNPLADKRHLRYPPIILEHGGTIDPTAYIIASSIQHHPEKWPRSAEDGPITSWNRSLAFVLANNGFDVWLAETRGSNDDNKRKIPAKAIKSVLQNRNRDKNMTVAESIYQMLNAADYWSFSQDDIIAHELKSHIDTVLLMTGANHVGLFTFSLSTPTSLAFFSLREDYAEKVQGFVSMAPIVSGQGVNILIKIALENICPMLPDAVGFQTFTELMFTQPMRDLLVFAAQNKHVRYSLMKLVVSLLMGPSAKWKTLLDLNLIGHLLRQLSFREAKQLCQQMDTNKLQKYDFGPIKNQLLYNQTEPPVYDLTRLHIKDWIVVAATNDALSTMPVLDHLLSLVEPKPMATILAPGFNHLDLIAAMDNDKYVNLPVLAYFESMSHVPGDEQHHLGEASSISERTLDFSQFLPKIPGLNYKPSGGNQNSNNSTSSTPYEPGKILENMTKNLQSILSSFGSFDKFFKLFDQTNANTNSNSNSNRADPNNVDYNKVDYSRQ